MTRKIFLIGMPGAGKTYWGDILSRLYGLAFYDLDTYIEEKEQKTIAEFFMQHDEKAFREIENAFLTEIIEDTKGAIIVACGGGTPCYKDNMSLMKHNGVVIYLKVSVSILVERLKKEVTDRPLLAGHVDIDARLRQLLKEREDVYKQADYILPADYISAANFEQIFKNV